MALPAPQPSGLSFPNGRPALKLAELTAIQIEKEIAEAGWPEGRLLGTEPDLQARYGVSRAVLREAIRLLEHHGVATMRRGGAGGLIVARPSPDAAVRPSELYLEWAGVDSKQLLDARSALEMASIRLAVENLTEDDARRLRACVEAESRFITGPTVGDDPNVEFDESLHDIHLVLAEISGNPALRLFIEVLTKVTHEGRGPGEFFIPGNIARRPKKLLQEVNRSHQLIADAVISGDIPLASHRMTKHLEALSRNVLRERQS